MLHLNEIIDLESHFQADIKAQYYKLSKIFHPDANKDDSEAAAENFRLITEAYEVLGNYRLRKLYDKGLIHSAGKQFAHHAKPQEKTQPYDESVERETDDDTTRFYKSRLTRQHRTGGDSKIYDFDEWTKGHYGQTFQKAQVSKGRQQVYKDRETREKDIRGSSNVSFTIIGIILLVIILAEISMQSNDKTVVIEKNKK